MDCICLFIPWVQVAQFGQHCPESSYYTLVDSHFHYLTKLNAGEFESTRSADAVCHGLRVGASLWTKATQFLNIEACIAHI